MILLFLHFNDFVRFELFCWSHTVWRAETNCSVKQGKRDLLLFLSVWKTFYGLYSVLLLSTFSSVVVFFPLWLLKFLLHACAAGTSSALYSFICSYSGFGISAVSINFCHFFIFTLSFFVDTVSICTVTCAVIFADVSNLSTFTSTVVIDCYFFLLLFALFLLISCCLSFLRCCF